MTETKRPLKVFLCHARLIKDGVDAWLDKEKPCGEPSRTILPG